jgi:hypothetical protein
MKKRAIAILVLGSVLVGTIVPSPVWAGGGHRFWGPHVVIGGLAAGVVAAITFPLWALAAPIPYASPPVYAPAFVYAPTPASYAAAPVSQRAPTYAGPPPPPQVRREVVYPNGRYLLYGDGNRQPWQWIWVATPAAPPPPPPPQ